MIRIFSVHVYMYMRNVAADLFLYRLADNRATVHAWKTLVMYCTQQHVLILDLLYKYFHIFKTVYGNVN